MERGKQHTGAVPRLRPPITAQTQGCNQLNESFLILGRQRLIQNFSLTFQMRHVAQCSQLYVNEERAIRHPPRSKCNATPQECIS